MKEGKKYRIIGVPGSGKTFMSQIIHKKSKISLYDMDLIFWETDLKGYLKKRKSEEREFMLKKILEKDEWIIEGVYLSPWAKSTFEDADYIIAIQVFPLLQYYRLIKRYIIRKISNYSPKEKISDLIGLLKWSINYKKELEKFIKNSHFRKKIIYIKNSDELKKFINAK